MSGGGYVEIEVEEWEVWFVADRETGATETHRRLEYTARLVVSLSQVALWDGGAEAPCRYGVVVQGRPYVVSEGTWGWLRGKMVPGLPEAVGGDGGRELRITGVGDQWYAGSPAGGEVRG